jgi:hypothetical protein
MTMQLKARRTVLIIPFVVLGMTGCFSLGRNPPADRHYVLGGGLPSDTASPDFAALTIGVRRVQLASYLATPLIVVRHGTHRITFSEFHRWGEDLDGGIARAVAANLAARASVQRVDVAPWPIRERYDFLIQINVSRFEGAVPEESTATEGEVHLLATWEIMRQQDGAMLAGGTTDFRERGWRVDDYAGLLTMLDRGLNVLADDLVSCLASLGSAGTLGSGDDEAPVPARAPVLHCGTRPQ